MKNTKLQLVVIFQLAITPLFSQSDFRHGVFLELGGNAYHYSINYERQFAKGLTGRIGVGYVPEILIVPVTIGKIYGTRQHHFEIAGGLDFARNSGVVINEEIPKYFIALTAFIGYRYQRPDKRLFLRGGFTPILEFYESTYNLPLYRYTPGFYPAFGVGLGYRF